MPPSSQPPLQNCWDFNHCGREPGGRNASLLGVCPAAAEPRLDGVNGGKYGGRACWGVVGTLCHGKASGTFASTVCDCRDCDFYRRVMAEGEGRCVQSSFIIHVLVHGKAAGRT